MKIFKISPWCNLHKKFKTIVTIILILSALQPVVSSRKHCKPVRSGVLRKYCKGTYPEVIKKKYEDLYVDIGEEYTIYTIDNDSTKLFVTFDANELSKCRRIKFKTKRVFICLDGKVDTTIELRKGTVFCFNLNIQYVDDLLRHCGKKPGFKSTFVALHYASLYVRIDLPTGAGRSLNGPNKLWHMTVVSVVFSILWKYVLFA